MKRLIKENGMAMNKVKGMPGDTVTVYHGTGAQNIDSIEMNGLTENLENSYQKSGNSYGLGIWVTLNENAAKTYAIDSTKGFMRDNQNSEDENITQYFGYGAIFSFEVSKDSLNDEGSASINNLKSIEPITPDKIRNVKIFDISSNKEWVASKKPKLNKIAYHTNAKTKQWIDDRVNVLLNANPDMDESMAYGIAWKQFKKDHPSWKPKESKKTAEFLDGYNSEDSFGDEIMVEIYTNPTGKEIDNCKKNRFKAVRGVIDNGVEYCWRGDILHDQVKGVNVNSFRFAFEGNSGASPIWVFDAHGKYTLLELCKLVSDNANILSKYGNINSEMFLCYSSDGLANEFSDDYQDLKTINEYIKEHETEKIARLIKKAEYVHCHECDWDNGDFMYDEDENLFSWVPNEKTKKFKAMNKEQIYKSRKEYDEKNPDGICPKCGKKGLCTD